MPLLRSLAESPVVSVGVREKSGVAEDLEWLADFVFDVAVDA
jgi:hypothetical protein